MKRANIPTKDALTLVKFEIIGFILSPNVFNFIVYEKMKKQYLSHPNVPYDLYQLQYIRITCMQLVFYLWGTCGVRPELVRYLWFCPIVTVLSIHPLHEYVGNDCASPIFRPTTDLGRNVPNTQRCNQFLLWRSCNLHEPRHYGNTMSVEQKDNCLS